MCRFSDLYVSRFLLLDSCSMKLLFSSNRILSSSFLQPGTHLDQKMKLIKYSDFINKELILFSVADVQRSIPSMIDGLKPAQRKILFSCFKRNLVKEIKVSQFQGYVSEKSAYHHGDQSLNGTIIGMAQNFIGSNNINLLAPKGQFGTRCMVRYTVFIIKIQAGALVFLF